MLSIIKKVLLSSISMLGIGFLFWTFFFLNPNFSYAHETEFDYVTIYHNSDLSKNTEQVIDNVIKLIQNSDLFHHQIHIDLCLNDYKFYPHIHPFIRDPLLMHYSIKSS